MYKRQEQHIALATQFVAGLDYEAFRNDKRTLYAVIPLSDARHFSKLTGQILRRLYIMVSEDGVICRFGRVSEMCFAANV